MCFVTYQCVSLCVTRCVVLQMCSIVCYVIVGMCCIVCYMVCCVTVANCNIVCYNMCYVTVGVCSFVCYKVCCVTRCVVLQGVLCYKVCCVTRCVVLQGMLCYRGVFAVGADTHIAGLEQVKQNVLAGTSNWAAKVAITGTRRGPFSMWTPHLVALFASLSFLKTAL